MRRRVVRIAPDRLFEIRPPVASCLGIEPMLAGDAAQRQLVDVEVARRCAKNGVLHHFAYAGIKASRDPAGDLMLHLQNIRRIGGEAISPGDATVSGIDQLYVDDERALDALCRAFDQKACAESLA